MIKGIVRSINTSNQIVYKQARDQKAAPSHENSQSFIITHIQQNCIHSRNENKEKKNYMKC